MIFVHRTCWTCATCAGTRVEGYTAFYDSFRRRAAHGQTVVDGRVMIYPFGHFGMGVPPMLLGRVRQEILQDVLDAARL